MTDAHGSEKAEDCASPVGEIRARFGTAIEAIEETKDGIATLRVASASLPAVLRFLKHEIALPYRTLYDLTAIDERPRKHTGVAGCGDFTVVYHLLSFERNADVRLKVALAGESPTMPSVTSIWPSANWYEREAWDMLGVRFEGHPHLRRILMPPSWQGHPLRKDHPARATEMAPYTLPEQEEVAQEQAMTFAPEEYGLSRKSGDTEFMFLNVGPQHNGTHGVLRLVLQLDGERIVDIVPEIGFHHRAAEKMAERQTWHTYLPYTDRVDYLSGSLNNLAYVLSVERLAGIDVPERARVIRIMLSELFRIANHLVWYGTFAQDVGALSPVFYMFNDRERIFAIVEAITGARMHPGWFRIGGVAADLPIGWASSYETLSPTSRGSSTTMTSSYCEMPFSKHAPKE